MNGTDYQDAEMTATIPVIGNIVFFFQSDG